MTADLHQSLNCVVRDVSRDDIAALMRMCEEHARYEGAGYDAAGKHVLLERALFASPVRLRAWVAQVQDRIEGYITATSEFSTWSAREFLHVDCLFVRETHRNSGIGAALLAAVIGHAREHGVVQIQWQTPDWNTAAARFYRRQGAIDKAKLRFTLELADRPDHTTGNLARFPR